MGQYSLTFRMKAGGALLLCLLCLCDAGTDVHFELSIDHHENPHPEHPHPLRPTTTAAPHGGGGPYLVHLLVMNSIDNSPNKTYSTQVPHRAILLGAMKRIKMANNGFNFTYSESQDYGPYLESVNGLAGNATEHTYWQLLVKTMDGKISPPDVGIGCYIPKPNQQVYLKFTKG